MKIRLKDIALAAGVQPSTASLVLRNHPGANKFSTATRERILQVARELGYDKIGCAKRTRTIAYLVLGDPEGEWSNSYYNSFLDSIENACREAQYNLLVARCRHEDYQNAFFPGRTEAPAADGVIAIGYIDQEFVRRIQELQMPCVCLGDSLADTQSDLARVAVDALDMYMQTLRYFHSMRHKIVVALFENQERQHELGKELQMALSQSDIAGTMDLHLYINPDHASDEEKAHAFLWQWMNLPKQDRPTAVICNYRIGVSLLGALGKYNLRCPQDLSIIAAFDNDLCRACVPQLSAVGIDRQLGLHAAKLLISHIESGRPLTRKNSQCDSLTQLAIRDSVQPLKD